MAGPARGKVTVDVEECKGCGLCVEVCPRAVFAMEGGKAGLIDKDACIECGACKKNCPFGAIEVRAGVGCAAAILGSKGAARAASSGKINCGDKTDSGSCCG